MEAHLHLPEAGPGEQAALALHLLVHRWPQLRPQGAGSVAPDQVSRLQAPGEQGGGDDNPALTVRAHVVHEQGHGVDMPMSGGEEEEEQEDGEMLRCLAGLTRACASTLAACYQLGGSASLEAVRVEREVRRVVDGGLGDAVAALGCVQRAREGFGGVCRAGGALLRATLEWRGGDAGAVRCARRLLAALMPESDDVEEEEGSLEEEGGEEEAAGEGEEGMAVDEGEEQQEGEEEEEGKEEEEEEEEALEEEEEELQGGGGSSMEEEDSDHDAADPPTPAWPASDAGDASDEGEAAEAKEEEEGSDGPSEEEEETGATAADAAAVSGGGQEDEEASAVAEALRQPALELVQVVRNAGACGVVSDLLASILAHPAWLRAVVGGGGDGGTADVEPLPAAASALRVPCASLAPLVVLQPTLLVQGSSGGAGGAGQAWEGGPDDVAQPHQGQGEEQQQEEQEEEALPLACEHLVLLETLLGLRRAFVEGGEGARRQAATDSDDEEGEEEGEEGMEEEAWPTTEAEAGALVRLQALLLPRYHATLGARDRALCRVLLLADALVAGFRQRQAGGGGGEVDVLSCRLGGPLAQRGFAWGAAAAAASAAAEEEGGAVTALQLDQVR